MRSLVLLVTCAALWEAVSCETHALVAATVLQTEWYDKGRGDWPDAGWWNSANCVEALVNYMMQSNNSIFMSAITNTFKKQLAVDLITSGSYDDIQWWGLAWARAYEMTKDSSYLDRAKLVFDHLVAVVWDDKTCGGGLWWSSARTYKNAITNELFLSLCMSLYRTTNNETYLTWAQREWNWFANSGMINAVGLVNDGLTNDCKNNGQTEWTYNQGVMLSGLGELYRVTRNSSYLIAALRTANATISTLVYPDGILRESCEPNNCNNDQKQFKGIFVRHLWYFLKGYPMDIYSGFINRNAASVWQRDSTPSGRFGIVWQGPFDTAGSVQQTSALDVFTAANV